ncbi:type II toxin-antitoxin system RelE/ParE family toxin [Oceanibaculum sp.]|uniref:type II toxin-antitoxin system RelE/ParE family toxin n=1 Tax=Oceanibaculum sp. TaxID=1903597 RepID=UPI002583C0F4|nr:type II toxin-antitoxin system RelE/ParE family toxin [Oceanibaculum sp.]MCH2395657.1 type II toxin-antitoxin system RelE/ParE family toxin [Oceanibaculum sp.]
MMEACFTPAAARDVRAAIASITAESPATARALRNSIKTAGRRIGTDPDSGLESLALADPPIRFLILTGFPYVLVYDAAARPALILRMLHGASDLPELFVV